MMQTKIKRRVVLVTTCAVGIAASLYLAVRLASREQPLSSTIHSPQLAAPAAGVTAKRLPPKLFPREQLQIHTEDLEKHRQLIQGSHGKQTLPNTEPVEVIEAR
jgi:hypothetical protein